MAEETFEPSGFLRGVHVLLVEHEYDSRDMMVAVLEYAGALVTGVASARAALRVLSTVRTDVLVTEIALPEDDGYWLIREARSLAHTREIPAVAVTVLASRDDRRRALEAGFQVHLPKPVDPWELCRVIASVARRRRE